MCFKREPICYTSSGRASIHSVPGDNMKLSKKKIIIILCCCNTFTYTVESLRIVILFHKFEGDLSASFAHRDELQITWHLLCSAPSCHVFFFLKHHGSLLEDCTMVCTQNSQTVTQYSVGYVTFWFQTFPGVVFTVVVTTGMCVLWMAFTVVNLLSLQGLIRLEDGQETCFY